MKRLTIVGCGLLGGSVAAAARERRLVQHVTAIGRGPGVFSAAITGLSDDRIAVEDSAAVDAALRRSDLVVLAAPIRAILDWVGIALAAAPLVTDCGSTKRCVARAALGAPNAARFVPGHPMAGGTEAGAAHARADLFVGRPWILCGESAEPGAVHAVQSFVEALGALPVHMTVQEHDRAVALTSHVPQLVASALVALSSRKGTRAAEGPGFEATTRTAGGNPGIWRDIFETNADEIVAALGLLAGELATISGSLAASPPDPEPAVALLEAVRAVSNQG